MTSVTKTPESIAEQSLFDTENTINGALVRLVIGVTGHRDLCEDQKLATQNEVRKQIASLADLYPSTPLRLISPLAEGGDRLVVAEFLRLKADRLMAGDSLAAAWDLIVPLPLPEVVYRTDFPDTEAEFDALIAEASQVFELPQRPSYTAEERMRYGPERDLQYLDAGLFLIRHCHVLLALWDGNPTELTGGTAQIVHLKLGKMAGRHFNEAVHHQEYDCGPVVHIGVNRAKATQNSSEPNRTSAVLTTILAPTYEPYGVNSVRRAFSEIDQLNRLIGTTPKDKLAAGLTKNWSWLTGSTADRAGTLLTPAEIERIRCFSALDQIANEFDARRKKLILAVYVFGATTAFCLWTAIDGLARNWMVAGYVASFGAVIFILSLLNAKKFSINQFLYRIIAETCRVQFYWFMAQILRSIGPDRAEPATRPDYVTPVLSKFLGQQMLELDWAREVLRSFIMPPSDHHAAHDDLRQQVAEFWVTDQKRYFEKSQAKHYKRAKFFSAIGRVFYILGVGFAAIYLVQKNRFGWPELVEHALGIAAAVAPALALLLQGYMEKMGLEEQSRSYERMANIFSRAASDLETTGEHFGRRSVILTKLGTEAVTETTNWLVLKKSRLPTVPG